MIASTTLPRRLESVRAAAAFIVTTARAWEVAAADQPIFEVAVVEALNNTLQHTPPAAAGAIVCEVELDGENAGHRQLRVRVLDEAAAAPLAVTLPAGAIPWQAADIETLRDVPHSGYGLYLIRAVFSALRPVTRDGRHGVELELNY